MVISGVVSLAASGALLAIVVRWLLQLDVAIGWTACVGAVSLAMQPWLNDYLGLASFRVFGAADGDGQRAHRRGARHHGNHPRFIGRGA